MRPVLFYAVVGKGPYSCTVLVQLYTAVRELEFQNTVPSL